MGFSPPAGGSGGGTAAGWAVSRTGGMVTGASAMLGHERMAQKNERIWLLGAWNIRQQSDDGKAFKSKEEKHADL